MFPSTDANDASEEELEAESFTRGERGPASSIQTGRRIVTVRELNSVDFSRDTWSPKGVFLISSVPI